MTAERIMTLDRDDLRAVLDETERKLDPAAPETGGAVRVLGYGEVSVALTVDSLPGMVCKRMSGFSSDLAVGAYEQLVAHYLVELGDAGVHVAPTTTVAVRRPGRHPVVYLVQPALEPSTLGHRLLASADDATLAVVIQLALTQVAMLAARTAGREDGTEVALDGQLSNWSFGGSETGPAVGSAPAPNRTEPAPALPAPVLVDVGTPFIRRDGAHAIDREFLLAPVPAGIRAYYRRRGLVEAYLDDYFVPRLVAVDLLGNFLKEGHPQRVPLGLGVVNEWLASADIPGPRDQVSVAEVEAYYRKDADLLALYLRLRRVDRFLQTRVRRRQYDYVLPGRVQR